jgi:hypothetical protein
MLGTVLAGLLEMHMNTSGSMAIREALQDDFDFVVSLMSDALAPFYGGDHQRHAERIFATHISGV